jgi:hypothetical protein
MRHLQIQINIMSPLPMRHKDLIMLSKKIRTNQRQFTQNHSHELRMLDYYLRQIQVQAMVGGKIVFAAGLQIYGQVADVCWSLVEGGMLLKVSSHHLISLSSLVAQKTNYMKFETMIVPYVIIYVIVGFLTLFLTSLLWLIPFFIVFFVALALRFHIIRLYQIQQNHCCVEFLLGFFCCPCSIAQSKFSSFISDNPILILVSRHVFGYREALDGDARPILPDYYDGPSRGQSQV